MTRATRIAIGTLFASLTVLIAILVCAVYPVLDASAMSTNAMYSENTSALHNLNMPGMTEDRYAPMGSSIIEVIETALTPLFLPNTSGSGVCNIDITCDSNGNATN